MRSLIICLLISCNTFAAPTLLRLNSDEIIFGYEATFQIKKWADVDTVTGSNPDKIPYMQQLLSNYLKITGQRIIEVDEKLLRYYNDPRAIYTTDKEKIVITLEPGVLEWNMSPRPYDKLREAWDPVYAAASTAELAPYIYDMGVASGGGQLHVGTMKLKQNPFMQNPMLLRNMHIYMHEHPSLLYGFGEAFDVGKTSASRTFHDPYMQKKFRAAIAEFDAWAESVSPAKFKKEGTAWFVRIMDREGLVKHDHYLNMENIRNGFNAVDAGQKEPKKFTLEFRGIRPLKSPEQIRGMAQLILKMMDKLSEPGLKLPFRYIDKAEYERTFSSKVVMEDWEKVRRELKINDPRVESMMAEYKENVWLGEAFDIRDGLELKGAYSYYEQQGEWIEIAKKVGMNEFVPEYILYKGNKIPARVVITDGQRYQVAVLKRDELKAMRVQKVKMCKGLF